MADPLILVLGGTRSGKSRFSLELTKRLAQEHGRASFLATAWRGDPEMERRIARHQQARPAAWPTIDVGTDLAGAIGRADREVPILVEGLTLWLSAVAGNGLEDPDPILDGPVEAALDAIRGHGAPVVVVSDEIGLGMVPMHAGARTFRDLVGLVHQRFAAEADEVHLVVAGMPLTLKGSPRP
ncbi:MAG TPA: bifunctional adenosylcobinamide kinase/adenosylcobinamide-phosphate guanylyltransferase [Candidatus Limnocylindrales bacterium]|nr:bifunctional adenosylcobinamide kinase/adenosylcobinamide-phosphate guanylyltransferase [Candidatus Limnocylindrales bacterium]